jgi:hypothetical protein
MVVLTDPPKTEGVLNTIARQSSKSYSRPSTETGGGGGRFARRPTMALPSAIEGILWLIALADAARLLCMLQTGSMYSSIATISSSGVANRMPTSPLADCILVMLTWRGIGGVSISCACARCCLTCARIRGWLGSALSLYGGGGSRAIHRCRPRLIGRVSSNLPPGL